jgi:hypothetical protein
MSDSSLTIHNSEVMRLVRQCSGQYPLAQWYRVPKE